ncbi:peroxiredoxin family protein [Candidatus Poribacteria bacterium]|nr:peroxiredoxin family protein [Candidatus Poribacteria bacterium]MYH79325.1 peroxiredoxin family protein [Candidatus Poribacteria bacterium]MYK94357.1 peroxiredoxin family protein [Candidatus Poribacteria bacterium]
MDLPLLADPGSSVHKAYGIVKPYHFHRRDMYLPATFLIDKEGTLKWLYIGERNSDRPDRALILEQLSKL